jgi:hypothetical protein
MNTRPRVLQGDTSHRGALQSLSGTQVNIRRRFPPADLIAAHNRMETVEHTDTLKLALGHVRLGGGCDRPRNRSLVKKIEQFEHPRFMRHAIAFQRTNILRPCHTLKLVNRLVFPSVVTEVTASTDSIKAYQSCEDFGGEVTALLAGGVHPSRHTDALGVEQHAVHVEDDSSHRARVRRYFFAYFFTARGPTSAP